MAVCARDARHGAFNRTNDPVRERERGRITHHKYHQNKYLYEEVIYHAMNTYATCSTYAEVIAMSYELFDAAALLLLLPYTHCYYYYAAEILALFTIIITP